MLNLWIGILGWALAFFLFINSIGSTQAPPPEAPLPPITMTADSAMVWISTGRVHNIHQAARDMEVMATMLEAIYQEVLDQETRADSLQNLLGSPP